LKSNKTGEYPVENDMYQLSARFCWILVDKIQSNSRRLHSSGDLIGQIPMYNKKILFRMNLNGHRSVSWNVIDNTFSVALSKRIFT
jgi:hypothetical protein